MADETENQEQEQEEQPAEETVSAPEGPVAPAAEPEETVEDAEPAPDVEAAAAEAEAPPAEPERKKKRKRLPRAQRRERTKTKRDLIGSLCIASRIASRAVFSGTPDSSNITRPGFTTATQCSGAPLPDPIRVSAGFCVTGLSGKTLIQTLPPRRILRVIAIRAASIWRFVIHPGSSAFRP